MSTSHGTNQQTTRVKITATGANYYQLARHQPSAPSIVVEVLTHNTPSGGHAQAQARTNALADWCWCERHRGVSLCVLSRDDMRVVHTDSYDTWGNPDRSRALAEDLIRFKSGNVWAIATGDAFLSQLSERARNVLKDAGCKTVFPGGDRYSYAAIVVPDTQSAVESLTGNVEDSPLAVVSLFLRKKTNPNGHALFCVPQDLPHPPQSTFQSDWRTVLNDEGSFPRDASIITCDGNIVTAHWLVLSTRSEYFRTMRQHNGPQPSVSVSFSKPVMDAVMEYLYCDQVSTMTHSNVMELWLAADFFLLPRLLSLCENYIMDNLSAASLHSIEQAAQEIHAEGLLEVCQLWMDRHPEFHY